MGSPPVLGLCCICKHEVTKHDLEHIEPKPDDPKNVLPKVLFCRNWPGSHYCCAEHPGILEDYLKQDPTAIKQ